jgi:hypothetical protein
MKLINALQRYVEQEIDPDGYLLLDWIPEKIKIDVKHELNNIEASAGGDKRIIASEIIKIIRQKKQESDMLHGAKGAKKKINIAKEILRQALKRRMIDGRTYHELRQELGVAKYSKGYEDLLKENWDFEQKENPWSKLEN